jgi:hypothetical protein
MARAAAFITPAAALRLAAAAVAGAMYGLKGMVYALLAISFAECIITVPTVLAEVSRIGLHRRGSPPPTPALADRQQLGLEKLLSLASNVASVPDGWVTLAGQVGAVGASVEERMRSAVAPDPEVS